MELRKWAWKDHGGGERPGVSSKGEAVWGGPLNRKRANNRSFMQ